MMGQTKIVPEASLHGLTSGGIGGQAQPFPHLQTESSHDGFGKDSCVLLKQACTA